MTQMTIAKGINNGLRVAMEKDSRVVLMGEDIGKLGGVFRITDGLQKDFGEDRVVDTPLAEAGILGTAVGLAMRGYRPVCEIQFDGFVFPAYNQIVTQVAKIHARSKGKLAMPIVIRMEGTNVEQGKAMLAASGLNFTTADSMGEAAQQIVALSK